jgi:hypothetical protein
MARKTAPLSAPDAPKKDDVDAIDQQTRPTNGGDSSKDILPSSSDNPPTPQNPQPQKGKKRTYRSRQECRDRWKLGVEIVTFLVVAIYTVVAYRQWRAMVASNDNTTKALQITQRAYVALGNKNGTLAEFGKEVEKGKRVVILHFVNSGLSTARHLVIHFPSKSPSGGETLGNHRHRFRGSDGETMTSGGGLETNLAGGAEHIEYLTDSALLDNETAVGPNRWGLFEIWGEIEYCDIFGLYHCEPFSARYMPSPIGNFVAGLYNFKCTIEKPDYRSLDGISNGKPTIFTEIAPCEQPDEPEYQREIEWPTAKKVPSKK